MSVHVGVGVIIEREGKILLQKRCGGFQPKWSIPGGMVDKCEHFEETATREIMEECGIELVDPSVVGLTNNVASFHEESLHGASVILHTKEFKGEPKIMEPTKCEELRWVDPKDLPEPHFDGSEKGIKSWLENRFY